MYRNKTHALHIPPRRRTIKSVWLSRWRQCGGTWTRPTAKAVYDLLSGANSSYTSLNITRLLRESGVQQGTTTGGFGHQVQVWRLKESKEPCERNFIANLF